MSYANALLYLPLLLGLVLVRAANRWGGARVRNAALVAASVADFGLFAPTSSFPVAILGYALSVALAGNLIARQAPRSPRRSVLFWVSSLGVVLVLCAFKYARPVGPPSGFVERVLAGDFVGLSYLTFRALDYLIQCRSGKASRGLVPVVAYLAFFPGFLVGPIPRYADFAEELERRDLALTFERVRGASSA